MTIHSESHSKWEFPSSLYLTLQTPRFSISCSLFIVTCQLSIFTYPLSLVVITCYFFLSLFTFHFSLFTFHFSLLTFHSSLVGILLQSWSPGHSARIQKKVNMKQVSIYALISLYIIIHRCPLSGCIYLLFD